MLRLPLTLSLLVLCTGAASARPGLRILIFDVGQGDAQLVIGAERAMLIDLGDAPGARRSGTARRLAPRIETLVGGKRLDYALVTHFHADHVGAHGSGLFALIDREGFKVGTLIDRGDASYGTEKTSPHRDWVLASARWTASGKAERRRVAQAGDRYDLGGGAVVEVVAAGGVGVLDRRWEQNLAEMSRCPPSENDYSVAVRITMGPFEYYTAGDLSGKDLERSFGRRCESYTDVESRIAARVGDVELMRASHHGSPHSSSASFVKQLDPEVSLVSTGGRYGHPATEVVTRLLETSAVFSTRRFSPQTWPAGPPAAVQVVGDILIDVAPGGATYAVGGTAFRSFTDAEEAAGLDSRAAASIAGTLAR